MELIGDLIYIGLISDLIYIGLISDQIYIERMETNTRKRLAYCEFTKCTRMHPCYTFCEGTIVITIIIIIQVFAMTTCYLFYFIF